MKRAAVSHIFLSFFSPSFRSAFRRFQRAAGSPRPALPSAERGNHRRAAILLLGLPVMPRRAARWRDGQRPTLVLSDCSEDGPLPLTSRHCQRHLASHPSVNQTSKSQPLHRSVSPSHPHPAPDMDITCSASPVRGLPPLGDNIAAGL